MKRTAVILEDQAIHAEALKELMNELGFRDVHIAHNAVDAEQIASKLKPDVVLLDVKMEFSKLRKSPAGLELDGHYAAEVISRSVDSPIVFVTALADELEDRMPRLMSTLGYRPSTVAKPVTDKQALQFAIHETIAAHAARNDKGKTNVFISYSSRDERWCGWLYHHLEYWASESKRKVFLDKFSLEAGSNIQSEILGAIAGAKIGVLCVSRAFLRSSFVKQIELPAFDRARRNGTRLIPIIVDSCDLGKSTLLRTMKSLNSTSTSLTSSSIIERELLWVKLLKILEEEFRDPPQRIVQRKSGRLRTARSRSK